MKRPSRFAASALVLLAAGPLACGGRARDARARAPGAVDLLVIAPHPDDETLIAGGVLRAAVARGERVAVVVVTNGDYTCERDGYVRERETVAAMARTGVGEDDVHFLGYPDGYLAVLGETPREVERRGADGACVRGSTTYGAHGAGRVDAHAARTGAHAPYTAAALEGDLVSLLGALAPRDVYVTHPIDAHPDHAATYAYLRRALERLPRLSPTLHRVVVHAGPCWPDGRADATPCPPVTPLPDAPMPPLPDPLGAYVPAQRTAVDGRWKLGTLQLYPSQTGGDAARDWLGAFARADEPAYPEVLARAGVDGTRARVRAAGVGGPRAELRARALPLQPSMVRTCAVDEVPPLARVSETGAPDESSRATMELLATADARYLLRVDRGGERATLSREGAGVSALLRAWSLPADPSSPRSHLFALCFDPRPDEGGVAEITMRRDGALVGVAIDPRPFASGTSFAVVRQGAARPSDLAGVAEPR